MGAARTAAAGAGDGPTERAAAALAELVATDPFAVTEADVVGVEQAAAASGEPQGRPAGGRRSRLDVDLAAARDTLAALTADVDGAADELAHAATRVAGIRTGRAGARPRRPRRTGSSASRTPRPSRTADKARVAADLAAWRAAADARRAEVDAALGPARAGMRRREEGQGLWTALRAKAGARKLDENPAVAEALTAAQDELWQRAVRPRRRRGGARPAVRRAHLAAAGGPMTTPDGTRVAGPAAPGTSSTATATRAAWPRAKSVAARPRAGRDGRRRAPPWPRARPGR